MMIVNYLIRPGHEIPLELSFIDARLIKSCGHCKVMGYATKYKIGKKKVKCQIEDNGKRGGELIEWFLN